MVPPQVAQEQEGAQQEERRRGGGAGEDQLREPIPRDSHDARVS
jgi:hypothetical protein